MLFTISILAEDQQLFLGMCSSCVSWRSLFLSALPPLNTTAVPAKDEESTRRSFKRSTPFSPATFGFISAG